MVDGVARREMCMALTPRRTPVDRVNLARRSPPLSAFSPWPLNSSILARPFRAIDDEHLHRLLPLFQLQP